MINIVNIDIFKNPTEAIIHQCNCFGTMGGGIAKLIREKYPEAAKADEQTKCGDKAKMGHYTCAKASNGVYIYNLYSQFRYGIDKRHTDYEAFYVGLTGIVSHMKNVGIKHASIPYNIGCGLGGGSWKIINSIIEEVFSDSGINLSICKHEPKK